VRQFSHYFFVQVQNLQEIAHGAFHERKVGKQLKLIEDTAPLPLAFLAIFFVLGLIILGAVFSTFPAIESTHQEKLKFPSNIDDVKELSIILSQYTTHSYYQLLAAYCCVYLFLQTFSIPGSIFLSFMAGGLFGLPFGVFLVCSIASIGASLCYLLSFYITRNLIKKFFPDKLAIFGAEIQKHRKNIMSYLLFLRITPFLPNWFINLASPLFGVSLKTFFIGTFFGVMPQTFIAVKAGLTLHEMKSVSDAFDITSIATMGLLAGLSLLPSWPPFRQRLDKLINGEKRE